MKLRQSFTALRQRNYRLPRAGSLISRSGEWMDKIALNWLAHLGPRRVAEAAGPAD